MKEINCSIYRAIKSSFPDNAATSGPDESIIVLYDSAKKYGHKKVLAHEFAHILWAKLSADDKDNYYKNASWSKDIGRYQINRQNFSEEDGRLNPEEDFSNNVEHIIANDKYRNVMDKIIQDCLLKMCKDKR